MVAREHVDTRALSEYTEQSVQSAERLSHTGPVHRRTWGIDWTVSYWPSCCTPPTGDCRREYWIYTVNGDRHPRWYLKDRLVAAGIEAVRELIDE